MKPHIFKDTVHSLEDAFLYLASCQLATVEEIAMKKSRPKGEYQRQTAIAQNYIDWIKDFKIEPDQGNRVADVLNTTSQSVADYVKKYEPK